MLKIFIGWDEREAVAADVLKHSLRKYSSIDLDIKYLELKKLDFHRERDPLQATDFTYTRFLVPHLCEYKGKAIFMDCDMLCLSDIRELNELDMDGYALRVVKQTHIPKELTKMDGRIQTIYPRKNWSSLMLMNCANLKLWSKEFVEKAYGSTLHRFVGIPDALIGELPQRWNELDTCTSMVHYTSGGPWEQGYENILHGTIWKTHRRELNEY